LIQVGDSFLNSSFLWKYSFMPDSFICFHITFLAALCSLSLFFK
jgi:hypothetical protein